MAETLGSLCDKLTVVKLKQWHAGDDGRRASLAVQEQALEAEIDAFVRDAVSGAMPADRLVFPSNKIMPGLVVPDATGESVGRVFSELAHVNTALWHEVERSLGIDAVPAEDRAGVVKALASLNLSRTKCIDRIDILFACLVTKGSG